jgi:hypothetical protein
MSDNESDTDFEYADEPNLPEYPSKVVKGGPGSLDTVATPIEKFIYTMNDMAGGVHIEKSKTSQNRQPTVDAQAHAYMYNTMAKIANFPRDKKIVDELAKEIAYRYYAEPNGPSMFKFFFGGKSSASKVALAVAISSIDASYNRDQKPDYNKLPGESKIFADNVIDLLISIAENMNGQIVLVVDGKDENAQGQAVSKIWNNFGKLWIKPGKDTPQWVIDMQKLGRAATREADILKAVVANSEKKRKAKKQKARENAASAKKKAEADAATAKQNAEEQKQQADIRAMQEAQGAHK